MTIFINRSIPLSEVSRNAWRNAGAVVLPRRSPMRRVINATEEDIILNLGIGNILLCKARIWNEHDSIRTVLTPAALRSTMPNLIPPLPVEGDTYWVKGPGQHGNNKTLVQGVDGQVPTRLADGNWDFQKHIEGTEFRVITVGNVVVQAHRKNDKTWVQYEDGEEVLMFNWEWVGVGDIKQNGIIPLVKAAVALVPNGDRCLFGWDVIVGETGTYIIEGNSSPGVNDATARRIVEQIRKTND